MEAAIPQFNLNDALPELVKEPVLDLDGGNVSTKIYIFCEISNNTFPRKSVILCHVTVCMGKVDNRAAVFVIRSSLRKLPK